LSNKVVNLSDYIKKNVHSEYDSYDSPELMESLIIGWANDGDGGKSLHVISSGSTVYCLWMLDLAKKIVEDRP
jgi:hypothetical protein